MLVLVRKAGEAIVIKGGIRICVLANREGKVRLGIDAPDDVRIMRQELPGANELMSQQNLTSIRR